MYEGKIRWKGFQDNAHPRIHQKESGLTGAVYTFCMRHLERFILPIFISILILAAVQIAGMYFGVELDETYPAFKVLFLGIPLVLVLFHSFVTLGLGMALFFLTLSSLIGFTSEYLGLKYGQFFGTFYIYNPKTITYFTVPVQVIFYWAAFIYTGYCVTNSYFTWLQINRKRISAVIFAVMLDALFVLAIDLFMDPLEVKQGAWTWIRGGPYFGVPLGNFVGWFTVATVSSGVFRTAEYLIPVQARKTTDMTTLIPVILYGMVALSLVAMALQFRMYLLLVVGVALMLPTVLYNLILFRRYQFRMRGKSPAPIR